MCPRPYDEDTRRLCAGLDDRREMFGRGGSLEEPAADDCGDGERELCGRERWALFPFDIMRFAGVGEGCEGW